MNLKQLTRDGILFAALPLVAVAAVRVLGTGAGTAAASPMVVEAVEPAALDDEVSLASMLDADPVSARALLFRPRGEIRSPMIVPGTASPEVYVDELPPEAGTEMPRVTVSSILLGSNPVAVINGRPRRIGDAVLDGWVLDSIADDAASVTIRDADGTRIAVRLRPPARQPLRQRRIGD